MENHVVEISFRPHHFLCAFCFQGAGYSADFIANFKAIMVILNTETGDEKKINITPHTDSICAPCPNRRGLHCTTDEKIAVLDQAHAKALDMKELDQLTWGEAKKLITEKISLDVFHQICAPCEWKATGICEGVIRNICHCEEA